MAFELPFGVNVLNPEALDKKYGPFATLAEAKTNVPISVRTLGLQVFVQGSGLYYWKTGLADNDLIPISATSTSDDITNDSSVLGVTVTNALDTLDTTKVTSIVGKQLSDENYTLAEKNKLAGLEDSKFKGQFISIGALTTAFPTAGVGDYAFVDAGVGQDVETYAWDSSDTIWVKQSGATSAETPATIKVKYESNADTNAFTDAEQSKLAGIAAGATVNATNAQLRDRATHTGTQLAATISDFFSSVLSTILSGFTVGANSTILATDTIISAFGKIQAQINNLISTKENTISATTVADYWRGDKTFQTLNSTAVGLSNVDNTSDINKPVSNPQLAALNLKENTRSIVTIPAASGVINQNLSGVKMVVATVTGNITFNFSNAEIGQEYTFVFLKGAANAFTITWTATKFEFSLGNTIQLTNTVLTGDTSAKDIISAVCTEAGVLSVIELPRLIKN